MPLPRTDASDTLDGGPFRGGSQEGRRPVARVGSFVWKAGGAFERAFLREAPRDGLRTLLLPRLRAVYRDGHLLDHVEREHHTRETILEREWTDGDVRRFVAGLREWQDIAVRPSLFPWRRRLLGVAYPAFRLASLDKRSLLLCLRYLLARPLWRNVLTHYDLHTFNYAFAPGEKMSLLDFERMYGSGDPLFDLLYFCTIPPVRLEKWTFQARVLREFLSERTRFARLRARVILLQCNLGRLRYSGVSPEIYEDNVALLRNGRRCRRWWRRVTSS